MKKLLPQINGRGMKGMAHSEPGGILIRYITVVSTFTSWIFCAYFKWESDMKCTCEDYK